MLHVTPCVTPCVTLCATPRATPHATPHVTPHAKKIFDADKFFSEILILSQKLKNGKKDLGQKTRFRDFERAIGLLCASSFHFDMIPNYNQIHSMIF
jgi:hypothetical protein